MNPATDVPGLRVSYGTHTVLDGLDLEVAPGEVFALLGPNGAGKTTAISVLTTLLAATAGTVRVAGQDVASAAVEVRRRIALTGQSAAVDDMLTAQENLVMLGRLSGLSPRSARIRADELLAGFSLTDRASKRVKISSSIFTSSVGDVRSESCVKFTRSANSTVTSSKRSGTARSCSINCSAMRFGNTLSSSASLLASARSVCVTA